MRPGMGSFRVQKLEFERLAAASHMLVVPLALPATFERPAPSRTRSLYAKPDAKCRDGRSRCGGSLRRTWSLAFLWMGKGHECIVCSPARLCMLTRRLHTAGRDHQRRLRDEVAECGEVAQRRSHISAHRRPGLLPGRDYSRRVPRAYWLGGSMR